MATDSEKETAVAGLEKAGPSHLEDGVGRLVLDEQRNKKLLRRIDWRVMPVVSRNLRDPQSPLASRRC